MKPIIISVTEEKDGYIRLKKEDLEKYIEDAYQTGVRDGRTSTLPVYPNEIRGFDTTPIPCGINTAHNSLKKNGGG